MSVFDVTRDNFQKDVMESDKPVLLDFWAEWCVHCRRISPIVEEIAAEHPEIKVGKVNVDEQQELASKFQIMTIPTFYVVKNGEVVTRAIGAVPKQQILALLD